MWAGTGFMYEFQLKMNPLKARKVLEDKIAFNEKYNSFIKREYVTISTLVKDPMMMNTLIRNGSENIVLKNSLGQAGKEVRIISSKDLTPEKLIRVMNSEKYDLAEDVVSETGSALVGMIGNIAILYRENPELEVKARINPGR